MTAVSTNRLTKQRREFIMPLPYRGELTARARELRKNMTKQERKLWYLFLSKNTTRFQRQKVISGFIVDFYCAKARLGIEIDGAQHYSEQGEAYDLDRAAILDRYHVKIMRFDNERIDYDFTTVCNEIQKGLNTRNSDRIS